MDYQRVAPVNVANELVNQWFDDFYHPSDVKFKSEFSTEELACLSEFNAYYEAHLPALPDNLEEMHTSVAWKEVVARAHDILISLGWLGLTAQYEKNE
ncbi:MAG: hypothetical protein V4488_16750 [Pseudomonadota bacterium]